MLPPHRHLGSSRRRWLKNRPPLDVFPCGHPSLFDDAARRPVPLPHSPPFRRPHAMSQSLTQLLRALDVAAPRAVNGLQVFGLRSPGGNGLDYTTLDDALAAGTLEVTEVSEG